jgi:hypothetical protein
MIQEGVSQIKVKTIVMFIIIYLFITFVKKKKTLKKLRVRVVLALESLSGRVV